MFMNFDLNINSKKFLNFFFSMKKIFLLTILTFVLTFSSSLTLSAQKVKKVNMKKPEKVALAFIQCMSSFDFKNARTLSTKESSSMFDMFEMFMSNGDPEQMKKSKEESITASKNIKKATCVIEGNNATCTACCDANNQPMPEQIFLKKVDGKWYAHMSKEEMMKQEELPIEAPDSDK
jgi:hypothetical protein